MTPHRWNPLSPVQQGDGFHLPQVCPHLLLKFGDFDIVFKDETPGTLSGASNVILTQVVLCKLIVRRVKFEYA
jgi:hypothetical protein